MSRAFRVATAEDVPALVDLINAAYRGDASRDGWTTEADLLDGPRTDAAEVGSLVAGPESIFLVSDDDGLHACVALRRVDERTAFLGMLVVRPGRQAAGTGSALMEAAEREVRTRWGSQVMTMSVIARRAELIAFYERRGYRRTGRTHPFPEGALSTPQVDDLVFEDLEKPLVG